MNGDCDIGNGKSHAQRHNTRVASEACAASPHRKAGPCSEDPCPRCEQCAESRDRGGQRRKRTPDGERDRQPVNREPVHVSNIFVAAKIGITAPGGRVFPCPGLLQSGDGWDSRRRRRRNRAGDGVQRTADEPRQREQHQPRGALLMFTGTLSALAALSVCVGFASAAPCPGTNGHLRFGSISYRQVSGYTVSFKIETQWRRSFSSENVFAGSGEDGRAVSGDVVDVPGVQISAAGVAGPVVFQTGDGTQRPLFLTVTHHSLNNSADFLHGYSMVEHTYRAPNDGGNDWLASLSGCCRQYGPAFREFQITARVNLALDGESLRAKALPMIVITNSPVMHSVNILANTYMGATAMAWRIAQGSELGTATMPPTSAATFPVATSGMLALNGSALGIGCHPIVVQIASVRSVTPYDAIIKVIPHHMEPLRPVFILGKPLLTSYSSPGIRSAEMGTLHGYAGYMIYFTLSARTSRVGSRLADIRSMALPEGAILVNMTTEGSLGNHILHVDFRWTPEVAQSHTHFVCFEAIDAPSDGDADMLSSGQHCVQLEVEAINPAPAFDQPAPNATALFYMRVPNAFIISVSLSVSPSVSD